MIGILRPAASLLGLFTLLLGLAYPALVTGVAQIFFRGEANGSLIEREGQIVGSARIGQTFTSPGFFWGRPSATAPVPNNAAASGGSNLGPMNPALIEAVRDRIATLQAADPGHDGRIPVDLVTASGSGLDPDISPEAALFQAGRVARARGLPEEAVRRLISEETEGGGLFGDERVNVLHLNLALEDLARGNAK